jgi:hypothetical protein
MAYGGGGQHELQYRNFLGQAKAISCGSRTNYSARFELAIGENFSKYQAFRRHWPLTRGADDDIYRKSFLYPVNGMFGKV